MPSVASGEGRETTGRNERERAKGEVPKAHADAWGAASPAKRNTRHRSRSKQCPLKPTRLRGANSSESESICDATSEGGATSCGRSSPELADFAEGTGANEGDPGSSFILESDGNANLEKENVDPNVRSAEPEAAKLPGKPPMAGSGTTVGQKPGNQQQEGQQEEEPVRAAAAKAQGESESLLREVERMAGREERGEEHFHEAERLRAENYSLACKYKAALQRVQHLLESEHACKRRLEAANYRIEELSQSVKDETSAKCDRSQQAGGHCDTERDLLERRAEEADRLKERVAKLEWDLSSAHEELQEWRELDEHITRNSQLVRFVCAEVERRFQDRGHPVDLPS